MIRTKEAVRICRTVELKRLSERVEMLENRLSDHHNRILGLVADSHGPPDVDNDRNGRIKTGLCKLIPISVCATIDCATCPLNPKTPIGDNMEETQTTLVRAFENCAARRAAFQTALASARGNMDDEFFAFHGAFSMLYNLALPNTGVMDSVCANGKPLAHTINEWIVAAKSYKNGTQGGMLFEMLVAALADAGLV